MLLLLALLALPETVETEHYRLVSEGPRAEAEEFGRVLEAAYPALAAHFKAKPKLGKGEKLAVEFFETREAWAAAVVAAGAPVPEGAAGLYWPSDKTARLYRQPTRLFTRALLLHEATHQFHFLACTRNRPPTAYWYKEGVAEFLGWNHWDGKELALGVLPLVSLENYPAQALAELKQGNVDLEVIIEGKVEGSRPIAWAVYRHLATGNGGKPLKGFEKLGDKLDGGAKPSSFFWKSFGQPAAYRKSLVLWLEKEQQPFVPVFNEWESLGPDGVRGFSDVVTACRLQATATRFQATIEVPKDPDAAWRGGGLLHYEGPDDYTVFLVDRASFRVTRRRAGAWEVLAQGAPPAPSDDGNHRFETFVKDGAVHLTFEGGAAYGPWELPKPAFGLALEKCDLAFSGLEWK
jgi:hypothetical protein